MTLKTTDIRLTILRIVGDRECYGYEIHKKFVSQNKEIDIGRLYKVLKDMLTEGVLSCRWERSEKGPEKRIYKLTEKGRRELDKILLDAIETIHAYYSDYLLNLPTEKSIFEVFAKIVAPEPMQHSRVAFFAPRPSVMHERLLTALQKRLPESEIYMVHPKDASLQLGIKNTVSLTGKYDCIPLRAKYVDLLVLDGLPGNKDSSVAVEEWHRILKNSGAMVVIVPKVVFSKFRDPLAIGDFMEKMEHQSINDREAENGDALQKILEKSFLEVHRKEMLQMTFLIARKPATFLPSSS